MVVAVPVNPGHHHIGGAVHPVRNRRPGIFGYRLDEIPQAGALADGDGEADIHPAADGDHGVGIEAAVGPHRELAPGSAVAHPPHRFTQEVGGATDDVGQVWVGAETIRPAPPESGPAGAMEASKTRRTGATRPKTGGSTICGGILVRVRGWKGLYGPLMEGRPASAGASRRGIGRDWRSGAILGPSRSSPAPGPAVDRLRRSGPSSSSTSSASSAASKLPSGASAPWLTAPSISPAPPGGPYPGPCRWPLPGPLPLIPPPRLVRRRPAYPLGQAHMVISEAPYIYY